MTHLVSVCLLLLGAGDTWEQLSSRDGVVIMRRDREGSEVREVKATGLIKAPPETVWRVLNDFNNYKKITPNSEVADVIGIDPATKKTHIYFVINPPLISRRDYALQYSDQSKWDNGKGFYLLSFQISDRLVAEKKGMVRIKIFDGYWKLEPSGDGKETFATYVISTDPGGSIPTWIVNKIAGSSVREAFNTIRDATVK